MEAVGFVLFVMEKHALAEVPGMGGKGTGEALLQMLNPLKV